MHSIEWLCYHWPWVTPNHLKPRRFLHFALPYVSLYGDRKDSKFDVAVKCASLSVRCGTINTIFYLMGAWTIDIFWLDGYLNYRQKKRKRVKKHVIENVIMSLSVLLVWFLYKYSPVLNFVKEREKNLALSLQTTNRPRYRRGQVIWPITKFWGLQSYHWNGWS